MKHEDPTDTIAAISTAPGEAGVAIIRVSGAEAKNVVSKIFKPKNPSAFKNPQSHHLYYGDLYDAKGAFVDDVLVSYFEAPNSYTGEQICEINMHGGLRMTNWVLQLVIEAGARHAEPGEFTKRAFLNGKMDLAQAEAVMDVIKAKSEKSAQVATSQLHGNLSTQFKVLKDDLMKIYAHMEAFLDFPEEDLEVYDDKVLSENLSKIRSAIQGLIGSFQRGALIKEGVSVAIVGKPNVGKSSLFNMLLARDRALVSEFPGTTRDTLEEAIELGGYYFKLVDTAGLTGDLHHPVDKLGMEKTKRAMQDADIYLLLLDGARPLEQSDRDIMGLIPENKTLLSFKTKADLPPEWKDAQTSQFFGRSLEMSHVSVESKEGVVELERKLIECVAKSLSKEQESQQITRLRHRQCLEKAEEYLGKAQASLEERQSLELVIMDIKAALEALQELVGEVYSETLLDVVFSEFCIGK